VWAVSAKGYVLFNNDNGNPVIRKASAHGLGHLFPPYDDDSDTPGIASPSLKLTKIGVYRWQHDLWWRIAKAAIDGKSDQDLKFDFDPALNQPAISRYAATTPKNLKWFDNYNSERPYPNQVKPFGFVSALYARNLASEGQNDVAKRSQLALIKPVAPFEKDPKRVAKFAFDRLTGLAVSPKQLKTYQEALAQYHLHPEDKFRNGDYLDRSTTQRRHVFATEIQYIGKESNKWEEQYYLGFDPDEEIHYGAKPATKKSLLNILRRITQARGLRTTAKEIGISRGKLSKLLENGFSGCSREFMQRISRIVVGINSKLNQENRENSNLLRLVRTEIRKIGISELARSVKCDPANLAKMVSKKRPISASALSRLNAYFVVSL
jgi:hypothetical protein